MSTIAALYFLMASASVPPSPNSPLSAQEKEVLIDEGERPEDRWRRFGGRCGANRYEVTIAGKKLSQSVRDAKVDGVSYASAVKRAMAQWAGVKGLPMDVVVDRCEPGRARVGIHIWRPTEGDVLHVYYLWLGNDGSVELLGER